MNTQLKLLAALALLVAGSTVVRAQNYSLDWYTIDGGGGTSSGGTYSVSGTIGQPDTAVMAGGNYRLEGGFWSVVAAIQTPGAPTLSVLLTNGMVMVSWPQPAPGWVLYSTPTLTGIPVPWMLVSPPYQTNATEAFVQVSTPPGSRFYRLQKP